MRIQLVVSRELTSVCLLQNVKQYNVIACRRVYDIYVFIVYLNVFKVYKFKQSLIISLSQSSFIYDNIQL